MKKTQNKKKTKINSSTTASFFMAGGAFILLITGILLEVFNVKKIQYLSGGLGICGIILCVMGIIICTAGKNKALKSLRSRKSALFLNIIMLVLLLIIFFGGL